LHLGQRNAFAAEFYGTLSFVWHTEHATIAGMNTSSDFLLRSEAWNLAALDEFIRTAGGSQHQKDK
jgi:hypothetical protein